MALPDGIEQDLIPPATPSPDALPSYSLRFAEELTDFLRLSYLWTSAMAQWFFVNAPEERIRGISDISFGFIEVAEKLHGDIPGDTKFAQDFVFGASIYVKKQTGEPEQRLLKQRIEFRDEDVHFPILVTYGAVELHAFPPDPDKPSSCGTSTCWVTRTENGSLKYGILTCRHVVKTMSIGSRLDLQPDHPRTETRPTSAELYMLDEDRTDIDAAMLEIRQADWPSTLSDLYVKNAPAAGDFVDLQGRISSTTITGKILRVFQDKSYTGSLFGQRVILDFVGQSGDSGALVRDHGSQRGVGIYIGRYQNANNKWEGICQDLNQAKEEFEVDLHL